MVLRANRLERITNLVLALLDTPRPLSLREIGDLVAGYPTEQGALRQAFERDKRTLRDNGIPVAVERINGDDQVGYTILAEDYYLPDLGLSVGEEQALAFAVAAVRIDGDLGRGVLAKLGAPEPADMPPVAILPSLPALGVLQHAVRARSVVEFDYRGRRRAVEPYGLLFRSGAWYLVGRDRTSGPDGGVRTFRVDRLDGPPTAAAPGGFTVPEGFDIAGELHLAPWRSAPPARADGGVASRHDRARACDEPMSVPGRAEGRGRDGCDDACRDADRDELGACEVVVEVDVREARAALALAGPGSLEVRHGDGSVRLRFPVADEAAFLSWVLGCADALEVVEPERLRTAVVEALTAATRR